MERSTLEAKLGQLVHEHAKQSTVVNQEQKKQNDLQQKINTANAELTKLDKE